MEDPAPGDGAQNEPRIDSTVPQSARIWNYWLGGKDNYPVDRAAGDQFVGVYPQIVDVARHSRSFLSRAVRYLAAEAGIRQFLDIGTGLPTVDNTHEVAQRVAPEARIVYVDNDPLVLAHARALLTSSPQGVTDYIDADLRDPGRILAEAARTLDFDRPVALMLLNILGHVPEYDDARAIVTELMAALAPGSHLAVADGTDVLTGEAFRSAIDLWNDAGETPYHLRTPEQIGGYFDGLEILEPGVVSVSRWRAEPGPFGPPAEVDEFCAVGRKPPAGPA
ncbi:SAM-dependent methyltransferase [Actinomadura chibensis]|uniref:SAM-dependent methyltransferase n=1 Tax=Actinomadura chibensis TaxID=392828 RepID=A0A5D0NPX0_9ACTN|nr:SAM-dependent methyltransferase [Actinomadura chibensis]TYB46198.1 SAM-dependent methyltransferase [Actinomadura chibensis]